jgi:hypothetical protein
VFVERSSSGGAEFYDPFYGVAYTDKADFESHAVFGYAKDFDEGDGVIAFERLRIHPRWKSPGEAAMRGRTMTVFIFATLGTLLVRQPDTSGQTSVERVTVETPRGPIGAQASEARVDLALPPEAGESGPGAITTVFEPTTGLWWWKSEKLNSASTTSSIARVRNEYVFYLAADKLISFAMLNSDLLLKESTDHATDLRSAMAKAAAAFTAKRQEIRRGGEYGLSTRVDLSGLGRDFFTLKNSVFSPNPPRVGRVSLAAGRWDVLLQGPNGDSVIVTLDQSYKLLGTRPAR